MHEAGLVLASWKPQAGAECGATGLAPEPTIAAPQGLARRLPTANAGAADRRVVRGAVEEA